MRSEFHKLKIVTNYCIDSDSRRYGAAESSPQHHNGLPNPSQVVDEDLGVLRSASAQVQQLDPLMNTGAQAQMMSAIASAANGSGGYETERELSRQKKSAHNRATISAALVKGLRVLGRRVD